MNGKNLEILGLSDGATFEDVKAAYETLRAKYLEERFMDGEIGNNAAKMLTRIETAYGELEKEYYESADTATTDSGNSFARVEELLKAGDIQEAQRVLDAFNERGAQWHYLQSVVFYRKNWTNESKKQLEIAIQLDPSNEKYKETYRKLNEKIDYDKTAGQASGQTNNAGAQGGGAYRGETMDNTGSSDQMGGNACAQCLDCCYTYMCISCLCDGCCR